MINDLKLASLHCSYWKYVGDITISEFAAACGVSILQSELDDISTWAATNNMVFNPKKCKEMTLRFRRVMDHIPSSSAIDSKALESVDAHKVLGVTIQSNLKWDLHINKVVAKASKRLHILRVLKHVEYHLPTYLRFILRSLGLSLNTVVLCGISPSPLEAKLNAVGPILTTFQGSKWRGL